MHASNKQRKGRLETRLWSKAACMHATSYRALFTTGLLRSYLWSNTAQKQQGLGSHSSSASRHAHCNLKRRYTISVSRCWRLGPCRMWRTSLARSSQMMPFSLMLSSYRRAKNLLWERINFGSSSTSRLVLILKILVSRLLNQGPLHAKGTQILLPLCPVF